MKQYKSKGKKEVTLKLLLRLHPDVLLIQSANRKVEFGVLKDLMDALEKMYDEFWSVNEEFEELVSQEEYAEHPTVNGGNVTEYRRHVQRSYEDPRDQFLQLKASNETLSKSQAAGKRELP